MEELITLYCDKCKKQPGSEMTEISKEWYLLCKECKKSIEEGGDEDGIQQQDTQRNYRV